MRMRTRRLTFRTLCHSGKAGILRPTRRHGSKDRVADLLIVEDDLPTRKMMRFVLEQVLGQTVHEAATTAEAEVILRASPMDLVISDILMPGEDGFEFCRRLRTLWNVPLLFVSGLSDVDSKVHGLKIGADDYLTKPFEPGELAARVEALLRRSARTARTDSEGRLRVGDITIDLAQHEVEVRSLRGSSRRFELSPTEFKLLVVLARSPGKAFTHEELGQAVWRVAGSETASASTLKAYVSRLRSQLEEDSEKPRYLQTVRGVGYRLDPQPSAVPA